MSTVNFVSATNYNDILVGLIGQSRSTFSVIDEVYTINITSSGVLGVISGNLLTDTVDKIPSEGSSVSNPQWIDNISFGISYTLLQDSNNNRIFDSSDKVIDLKTIESNVSGFVIFQKSLTSGTYFIKLNDSNGTSLSKTSSGILFDPGELYGESIGSTNSTNNNSSHSSSNNISESSLNSPIYRFQNKNKPGTYVFASEQEGKNIIKNYSSFQQEGFAFAVGMTDNDNLMPMYRFQNSSQPGTYLYVTEGERSSILANYQNFKEEGLAFYVINPSANVGDAFYRFQNNAQPGTYIFVGEGERKNILNNPSLRNFQEEGIAFKVSTKLPSNSLSRLPENNYSSNMPTGNSNDNMNSSNFCGQIFPPGSGEYNSCVRNLGITHNNIPDRDTLVISNPTL